MRTAKVFMHKELAGELRELLPGESYEFVYREGYAGTPVSLTMPITTKCYSFRKFPPFFEGLLPEGIMLEGLLRHLKIERNDLFSQILATGGDLVGAVTVKPADA